MRPTAENPYAPPAGDASVPAGVASPASRGLRVAGGVMLLLLGVWSTVGGSCAIVGWQVALQATRIADDVSRDRESKKDRKPEHGPPEPNVLRNLGGMATGLMVAGPTILLAGVLCFVAAILLFLDRGRRLGHVAVALGALGELLFFGLVAFNVAGLVKLAAYTFCGFAAMRVGRPPPELFPGPAP